MTNQRNDFDPKAYNPSFQWSFLTPKLWGTWLAVLLALPLALLPLRFHQWLARIIALKLSKSEKGPAHRARVNFELCFPNLSFEEREQLVYKTLYTAGVFVLRFSLLTLKSKSWLQNQCDFVGRENLTKHTESGENVILLVPHSWAIDIPAVMLASMGLPVSAMAKKQKNPVSDWLMHRQRVQYGGRVYERSGGIKPFIKSVKDGYLGYYLPDQDHGAELSEFVDFFATTKATLPGLSKLAKLSRATIVPLFASMDPETGKYSLEVLPALELQSEDQADARSMNVAIETFVKSKPEQYMWILQLLYSQKDGKNFYNLFKPRYKSDWKVSSNNATKS
ncbi:lauroyl-Kdo(2)-lipid IV(A) myristoyltransferase [Vibrio sp. ZF57]|uniref:lauroyl-Kdo(2)-lipid IV(A) myristoyltransferase n=1 Tax=Vibrio sp. ZF57 TaxID=1840084 RepID=UPI00080DF13E|nr:lauroyl-Kdo(2)-lipid IV(A) myristoyltransferase [Vibrio sp. ZF57]OCH52769.1 lipid A biosynthesis (KDO)2-(lauroyl)-lipid IVA acyltransferase [Vibrio sp. ZF57]